MEWNGFKLQSEIKTMVICAYTMCPAQLKQSNYDQNRVTKSRKDTFAQLSFDLTLISNGAVKKASLASL